MELMHAKGALRMEFQLKYIIQAKALVTLISGKLTFAEMLKHSQNVETARRNNNVQIRPLTTCVWTQTG